VPVVEWSGLIFVQMDAREPELDLASFLGSFAPELAQLELASAAPISSSELQAETNWKLALDTYGESYHFATLHASTIGKTHYSNVAVFDAFDQHWRINFPEKSLQALVHLPEDEWPETEYGGVHFLFPNSILVVGYPEPGKGFLRLFRLFPGAHPGTMSCRISAYALSDLSPSDYHAEPHSGKSDAESDVTREDYQTAVDSYRNLVHAPPGFRILYGRNEPALQAFHRSIAQVLFLPLESRSNARD
jgi:hypothetical protein